MASLIPLVPFSPTINLTAWFWTCSRPVISLFLLVSQAVGAYSRWGMHRNLYASSFALRGAKKSARLIIPSFFLAVAILASMCLLNLRFSCSVTPTYRLSVTCSRSFSFSLYLGGWTLSLFKCYYFALVDIEFHPPSHVPCTKRSYYYVNSYK